MSRPPHNPYPFGSQSSTQRLNVLGSSGASSVTSDTSLGTVPSRHAFPVRYTQPQSRAITEEDMERSTEMRIGQAREEMRHQPVDQGPCFTSTQRDKFISSTARVTSSPVCSSSQRHSDFKSGASSLDWPSYKKTTEDDSSRFFSSSTSLSFLNSGGSVFNASSERECDMQSIPGLGDYDYRLQDKPVVPSDSSYPKYTSQEAANILLRFGLEKEDLEYLITYPEDQITPGNLPFILRQIRMKKAENVTTTIHSKPCPEPQSTTSMTGMDKFSSLRGEGMHQDTLSPIIKPSKVIDYGHTSKYTGGFGDEIGRSSGSRANSGASGSMSLMDSYDDSNRNREPLQKSMTEVKTSALVSSCDQQGTVSSNSSMQSYVPPVSRNPTQQLQTQPSQASQEVISSFSLPKKDTDLRLLKSKPVPLKESEPDCRLALKIKPPPSLVRGVHPDRPGLVLIGSNDDRCTKDQSKSKGQEPKVAEQINKKKMHPKQVQQELKKQTEQQQQAQKQPVMPKGQNQPRKLVPPVLPQIIPKAVNFVPMPTLAMMQDYAAATPQTFPHTCSLCLQKCTCMKDWLLHQNTSLHLDNCKHLRKRYPHWDGKVLPLPSASGTEKKPSPSTSGKTSQRRHQKTRRESHSRSCSRSPRRRLGSDGRRPKRGSYTRSRSNSPHRYYSSDGRREKFGSGSQSPYGSRHTRRSRSRSFSPRYNRLASFHYRSRSRSHERRSSPRRRDEKQSVPKRSDERRSPPRRRDDKRLPPSRTHKRPSPEERLSLQQKTLNSSTKRLAKQLLETPALQSLSKQSDLETMAKTLAPVLLAELAKMKSPLTSLSSSASASLSSSKKEKTTKSSEAKPRLQKSDASSSSKPKTPQALPSTAVRLQGILKTISHEDVVAALEHFGKTESVVLYRSKLEAKVNFVKEDDAQKLKKLKDINIKGTAVTVVGEQDAVSKKPLPTFTKEQWKPSQKKTAKSRMTTLLSTKANVAGSSLKKPSSLPSGDKKPTTGKLVTKAKVLVSKAKSISTKQISKTLKKGNMAAKGAVKSVEEKKNASKVKGSNNSKRSGKQQDPGILKQRTTFKKSESNAKSSAVAPKNRVKMDKLSNKTAGPIKDSATVTHAKVIVTQAQLASTVDKPPPAAGTVRKQNQKETTLKGTNVTSKSTTSEKKPDVETFKTPKAEIKVQRSAVVSEVQAKVLEARNATASEIKNQAEFVKIYGKEKEVKHTEKLESGDTKVAVPMEVESFPESEAERCIGRKALMTKSTENQPPASTVVKSPPKAPADPSQTPQATVKSSETLCKASSQILESAVLEPDSTAQGQTQQQTAGSSAEVALESKQTAERVENIKEQKGLLGNIQATNVPSKSTASENKPDVETFKTPKTDTKVQESAAIPEDGAKVPETRNVSASKMTQQAELAIVDIKTKEASHTEPLESGNTKVTEPTEVESTTDRTPLLTQADEGHTPSTTEMTLYMSPTKLLIDPPQGPQTTIKKMETSEDTKVQESGKVSENTTKVPETKNVSACESKQQAELVKVETKEAKHTEPLESGNTKVTKLTAVEHTADRTALLTKSIEGQTPTSITETTPAVSPAKISPQKTAEDSEDTKVQESGSVEDDVEEKEAKHSQTLECGNIQVAEPMEVEHSAEKKALLTKSNDGQTPTTTAETTPEISITTDLPQRPQTIIKKTETLEDTEVQESATVTENTAKVLEIRNATASEVRHQTESAKAETEAKEPKYTGAVVSGYTKVAESMEDQSSDNGEKLPCRKASLTKSSESQPSNNTAEATLDVSLPKSSTEPLKTPQMTIKRPESSQILQSMTPDPESTTAQGEIQQQTAGHSTALEAKQTVQSVKTITQQKDPVIAVTTRKDPPSKTVSNISAVSTEVGASAKTEPTAAAEDKRQPTATVSSSVAFSNLTIGEKIEKLMHNDSLSCLKKSKTLPSKVLSITNLPEYHSSCYTEVDVANLLSPFGFQYLDDNIYIIPQMSMAFAIMPSLKAAENLIKASDEKSIIFNGSTLCVEAIISPFPMNPLGFYSSLMKLVHYQQVTDHGSTVIFIKRISPSEAGHLREALKKIGSVKNYLPLLNKVFIEFESIYDADRLGVWYSLLKQGFGHKVCRIKIPQNECTSRPPRLAAKALPDSKDVAEGATIPTTNFGVPQGSTSPFWVTMKTFPFLFPTVSPWFIIPGFQTVNRTKMQKTRPQGSVFPHVMLTGLPEGNYRHEDVAKVVWRYFPVHNHHTLNNSIIVLSLQRRAFVYFSSWNDCTNFVKDHIKNPVSVGGRILDVHFVLRDMHPGSSEEIKYRNMMKWSNAHVTELESLEERLLCVEISETSVDLIMTVVQVVASIAAFVRFLPLANRIYIEMAESNGVTQVLKNIASVDYLSTHAIWSKVRRIETLKNLKQHLQDSSDITVNLELDTIDISTKSPAVISGAQPTPSDKAAEASQQASSAGSLTAEQSAIATGDLGMKEASDKPGTEITTTSTIAPQTSQDVEKSEGREEGSPATPVTSADGSTVPAACSLTSLVKSMENIRELPVVKAHEPGLIQGTKTQHVDKKSPDSSNTTSRNKLDEGMIEEKTCKVGRETQNLVVSPAAKQISPRSLKDTKSSSSSSVSETSVSSSLQSIETPAFPSQEAQTDKPESPEIASHTPSSDVRACSSKMASTAAVDVAVETHQLHREDATPTESAVGKSDHKVSAESITTETKIETSLEMHSAAQRQELELTSQTQSLEMDFNNGILNKLKESTGKECEKEDFDKYSEEEDYEDYQILDSIDDQMDEQMDEYEHEDGTETKLSDAAQEPLDSHQVFDSVTEEHSAIVKEVYQEAAANKDNVLDTSKNQTPRSSGGQIIQKQEEMQRSFKASKDTSQIQHDEKQLLEDQDHKDVSTDADGAEEEAFEILDSIDNTDDHASSDTHLFGEQNFSLEDFVTVDEIEDDTEDVTFSHQSSSSSEQNSRSKREGESLDVSSSGKQTSKTSCSDSKISASHFASSSFSSKPADVTVKGSCSSSVSKTTVTISSKSVKARAYPGQKTQPSTLKSPVRATHTSSLNCRTHSLKTASAAASETSADTHKLYKEAKTAECAVVKLAQKVSTKRTAAKTAESESRQSPGPKKGQRLHEGGHHVMDSVTDKVKEECSDTGLDASLQVLGRVTKDKVAIVQEDSHLVEDEDSTEKKTADENKIQVTENNNKPAVQDAADKNEVSDRSRKQTLRAQRQERRIKEKEEMLSEESCKASKDAEEITSGKNQSSDDRDMKDNSSHCTDQEAFEILDSTDDHASSNTHLFDRQSFNLEDFVTVDEIVDDMEEAAFDNQSTSSSNQNSRRERESQGSDVSSSVKQTSTRSLEDSKSSVTCSSFTPSSSKPVKATVKSCLSMAVETPAFSVKKALSHKPKSPARALHTSSSGCRTSSSKKVSPAAGSRVETCQPNKEQAKSAESSVVKSDHKVSAEGIALKTLESSQSPGPGPEQGQKFHGGSYKVLDSIEDEGSEECSEMDASVKILDSVTEDHTVTVQEATQMVEDEGSTLKQLSDEHVIQVVDNSDKSIVEDAADKNEVLDTGKNQTSRSRGDGRRGKEKEEQMHSDEACKDSGQMTHIEDQSNTENSPGGTEQEAFEILDSADDHTDDQSALDSHLFDEQNFNLENFVTVDEIVDDTGDDQCSDVFSSAKQTTLRSSKDSESSLSPSSSKPTKSTVKNSLSSCVRKTSATSSLQSETSASSGQKGLSNKSSSSGCRTRSSKLASTTALEATIETHQFHREEANPTKSAGVKSAHKISAKDITTQNVESESRQSPGAEQGPGLHEGGFQVLDNVKDDCKACSEECIKTGLDTSLQVLDNNTQDQMTAIQDDKLLVKDESSTVKQLSEENLIQVVGNTDKYAIEHAAVENKGLDKSGNQPLKSSGNESKGEDKEKLSEESSKASKDAGQIPTDKDEPLEDRDNKASVTDGIEQEAFEIVDSIDDHADDQVASDTHLFNEQNFNFESFVTVDEIVDETVDTAFDHKKSSSSQQTTRWKRKRQSSDVSSSAKYFSARSTKDSKSQASLSYISKPTEDSVKSTLPSSFTSVTRKKQKDSFERTKFNTRPFASPRGSKNPLSSSPLSVKTHASPCLKAQLHKTESQARAPHTVPRGCRTHSSKMASTADIEVSVKTQHSHREEEKPTESDHKVSAEGITADTKIETSPKMHPPAQGKHRTQSLKIDFKDERYWKGDYVGKYIEEEEDEETYQIIDSVDDQTEEKLDEEGKHDISAKAKSPGPEQGQKLHKGGYQSLDFVEDKFTIQNNKNQDIQGTTTDDTEGFEILDSVDDLTEKDDDCQTLENLSNEVSKGDREATEEEEEAYEVIDSVEDEPTTTETELEADNKEKRTEKYDEAKQVDRPTRRSGPRTRTSKSEEKWKSPMKEDKMVKKYKTRTKKSMIEKNTIVLKNTEEIIQVSFDEDESIQDASTPERSDRSKSVRGNKDDELACTEAYKKHHGAETDNSNPAIMVRSTSGRRKKTPKEVSTKDKTSTRRPTGTRDLQEQNLEKTAKTEEKAPLNKRTPTKESDTLIKDLSEKEATYEILHPVKDDIKDDQPGTLENTGWERPKKYIEKTFLDDTSELVTLDEVGADEGGEDGVLEGEEWNREITEDELQEFVTLDEIVEEEEKEVCTLNQDSQSVQPSNRETLANVKEAGDDENQKGAREGAKKISRSAKRKHDDNTEEDGNFGRDKEKEVVTTRTRGRAMKRTRQKPVRKSVSGKKGDTTHERQEDVEIEALPPASLQPSSSPDKKLTALSGDSTPDIQKTEEEAASHPSVDTASAWKRPTHEGWRRTGVKAIGKRRRELLKPEAKRPRSQSPCITDDLDADSSLGEEHMVPKMGLFCNLCSIFYLDEQNAKDLHCRSQKHQENLKKHQQKLRSRPSRMSTRNSQGSVLD
ncbi:uncharacterized protein LOC115796791 isoform X2 [Archocentrus centrarchus]|uniref:uncharacterized protein LOC115796791 isoform X2 n=1 Tax=Archocentrus centrarchus TaxID=63155 RepID=UPI0011E9B81D|nr:uncharacterized protein LOC115796791 isoform X2 [Archocentrus centrarchus]